MTKSATALAFQWEDPLLLERELSEDERMVMEAARAFARDRLMPRILKANREEKFDRDILNEYGEAGFLGAMIPEAYGGGGANHVSYGLITREIERVDSAYRSTLSVQASLVAYPILAFGSEAQ